MADILPFLITAADASPNGMVCVDAERGIVATNRAFDSALGYERGALLGQSARHIYFDDHAFDAQGDAHVRFDLDPPGVSYALRLRRHDGVPLPVDVTTRPVRNGDALLGWVSVMGDRRPRERRHAFLEDVIETCSAPTGIEDKIDRLLSLGCRYFELPIGTISRVGGTTATVTHARAPDGAVEPGDAFDLTGTLCGAVIEADATLARHDVARSEANCSCTLNNGMRAYIGTPLVSDGVRIGTLAFASPAPRPKPFGEEDEALLMSLSSWIGEEMAIERTHQRLRREREHHHRLYRRTPAMLLALDARRRVVAVSDHALEKLGRSVETVLRADPCSLMDEPSAARAAAALDALADGRRGERVHRLPVRFLTPSGEKLEAELSAVAEPGPGGAAIHVTLEDVGERERAMAQLVAANEDLTRLNKGLREFAYIASHDLQEPLRKITQFASFLVEDYADALEGEARYFVDTLSSSAARMARLIEDLLAYSRITNATVALEPVALDAAIEAALGDLRAEDATAVSVAFPAPAPVLRTDAHLLRRLLENLLGNALKFRPPGERPRVHIAAKVDRAGMRIEVDDEGVGFEPALAEAIFEPFRRLHPRDAYPGSGIGLALCRAACDALGWTLTAISPGPYDSEAGTGGGAIFVLNVPRCDIMQPERARVDRPAAALPSVPMGSARGHPPRTGQAAPR